jgi:predicted DNA-binding protein with PD1-like motif
MIVFESRHARRFVGRLERGEDLVGSLRALAERERVKAAWVSATGLVEWAEVTDWDADREAFRAPRRIEGPLTILSLSGNVSLRMSNP